MVWYWKVLYLTQGYISIALMLPAHFSNFKCIWVLNQALSTSQSYHCVRPPNYTKLVQLSTHLCDFLICLYSYMNKSKYVFSRFTRKRRCCITSYNLPQWETKPLERAPNENTEVSDLLLVVEPSYCPELLKHRL